MSYFTENAITPTIMLIKFVNHRTHPIVPQLNDATVQARQNPWSFRMKGQPCQHIAQQNYCQDYKLQ